MKDFMAIVLVASVTMAVLVGVGMWIEAVARACP